MTEHRRNILSFIALLIIIVSLVTSVSLVYTAESKQTSRGTADFQLTYSFYVRNEGPVDLTTVTVRLAMLKDWAPIQKVTGLIMGIAPNLTTTDEYENEFAWYEYSNFKVNKSIELEFHANLTLTFVDYATTDLEYEPYDPDSLEYQLFTAFHPLADNTDPSIRNIAQSLESPNDIIETAFNLYNFTSTYLNYRLHSSARGASYALRNGEGDCDEYTTLFVALARALGIPAVSHTAWLADFEPGFISTDEGSIAHAYPMFLIQGIGMLPVDPTRGKSSLYDNWLKTDYKRITMTRGPDNPYRLLRYRWIPIEGLPGPTVESNYTISIHSMNIQYTSTLRSIIITSLIGIPIAFAFANAIIGYQSKVKRKKKLEQLLSPK
ncbi:MAG: transglutaminase family protein [Candidatus Thorarchaeota archaeon]